MAKCKNYPDAIPAKKRKADKEELSNRVDALTLKYLDDMKSSEKEYNELLEKEEDPDLLFLKSFFESLINYLENRIKIHQILFELEDSDED